MQLLNQTVLAIFALILLGVLSSTGFRGSAMGGTNLGNHRYWLASIICRVAAFLGWAVTFDSDLLRIAATASYTASIILLALFIRSWRQADSRRLLASVGLVWVGSLGILAYLLEHPQTTHSARYLLIASWICLGSLWEYLGVQRASRTDRSYLLSILKGIMGLQLLIAVAGIVNVILDGTHPTGFNFVQRKDINGSTVVIWVSFGVHLLSYIIINSYLYEKLRISERQSFEQLRDKKAKLLASNRENKEIHQLLQEREHLIASLIKANKTSSTGALAASIAHEMAQPLTVIQMNVDMLDTFGPDQNIPPALLHEMISGIRASSERAANTIGTLRGIFLDKTLDTTQSNLRQLVDDVLQLARNTIKQRGIRLNIDIPEPWVVRGYGSEIFQVILNLLNNAIQALADTPVGEGRLDIRAEMVDNCIVLRMADNGPGIAPEYQGRLFQLFEQGKNPGSMGLGLWLCAYIVHRHQGSIHYEDNPGGGACFILRLPQNP